MIHAGTCFCYRCGNLFQDAYYKTGSRPVGGKLVHARMHRKKPTWELLPFRPDGEEIKLEDAPRLVRVNGGEDGVPNSIQASFVNEGKSVEYEMMRCCPMCKGEDTQLPDDCGRNNTYVIAMVGGRTVGKSTWLEAISTAMNLEAVNQVDAYEYRLDFLRKNNMYGEAKATLKGSAGETNYLRIIDKRTHETVANVILLDAAGELFATISEPDNELRKFLLGHGNYKGVDALIYLESAAAKVSEITSKEDLQHAQAAFRVYAEMEKVGALKNKPIAYIGTHMDEMLKQKRRIPKVTDMTGEMEVPAVTEATFRRKTSYEPDSVKTRWAMEDNIARQLNRDLLISGEGCRRGFMVQSCQSVKLPDGTIYTDMSKNMNLMDPLLWILYALRLFPIPQE